MGEHQSALRVFMNEGCHHAEKFAAFPDPGTGKGSPGSSPAGLAAASEAGVLP
uniref:Uncharacterized protein n=1 Tax=Klebsiella pneumoniae TaxID=573 RepID=A0A8B0SWA9_KLEPN|nr:hypothetical protein [Klebsiella pneumoniae]